jgi:intracellular septation protein A
MPEMVAEAGLPYATYLILHAQGVSTVDSLLAGAVFPVAFILGHFARRRRLDGFGLIILATIVAGAGLALLSGSSRIYLVKESLLTGAFGVVLLASLLGRRPFMFYSGRKFATDGSPAGQAAWDSYWPRSPAFRRSNRVMTVVWGLAFLAEAAIRVVAAYTLPTSTVVALSATVPLAVIGLLMVWTFAYARGRAAVSRAEVMAAG